MSYPSEIYDIRETIKTLQNTYPDAADSLQEVWELVVSLGHKVDKLEQQKFMLQAEKDCRNRNWI